MTYKLASERYGIAVASLHRHAKNHPHVGLVRVTALAVVPPAPDEEDIGRQLRELIRSSQAILLAAEQSGSLNQAMGATHEVRQNLIALGQWLTKRDELALLARQPATVDLLKTEQFIAARRAIMVALEPAEFDAARIAVAKALMELDEEST
jgi:hypothetical protein